MRSTIVHFTYAGNMRCLQYAQRMYADVRRKPYRKAHALCSFGRSAVSCF